MQLLLSLHSRPACLSDQHSPSQTNILQRQTLSLTGSSKGSGSLKSPQPDDKGTPLKLEGGGASTTLMGTPVSGAFPKLHHNNARCYGILNLKPDKVVIAKKKRLSLINQLSCMNPKTHASATNLACKLKPLHGLSDYFSPTHELLVWALRASPMWWG